VLLRLMSWVVIVGGILPRDASAGASRVSACLARCVRPSCAGRFHS